MADPVPMRLLVAPLICSFGPLWPFSGRLPPCHHPARATARARISRFALANRTCRWLRFFARPR